MYPRGVDVKGRERFVIVGADAAGMSAASEARRADPDLEIVAYDKGGDPVPERVTGSEYCSPENTR
jgi:NADPH-dependent 2,4-dienoyl-CoA reductase/sulfur reductase-like enzyme